MMTRLVARAAFLSVMIFGLAACEEGLNLGGAGDSVSTDASAGIAPPTSGVRDVERPDIFSTTENGLWDGRPSLGGIWVAHPDVTTPERVIVTNNTTNQRIAAALFRRERDNPGPRVQLSSDAAAALNILAGAPTEVTIIAVRQEEVEVEEPDPVISDEDLNETAPDADELAAAEAATDAAQAEDAETQRRPNFFERLFGGNRNSDAAGTAAAVGAAAATTVEDAGTPEVETQTLDPVTTGAAAAIARAADANDKPVPRPSRPAAPQEDASVPPPAPAQATTPSTPVPAPTPLENPFIQVGLYSVEANAFSAHDNLRTAGIVPTVYESSGEDGPIWRVVVGPMTTRDDQAALLAQVRRLGFTDAFLTKE